MPKNPKRPTMEFRSSVTDDALKQIGNLQMLPLPSHLAQLIAEHMQQPQVGGEVMGDHGKAYTVRCVDGKWSCTCRDHEFRGRECKHICRVKEASAKTE